MSWDLEINAVFKNINAPVLEPWETGRIEETIPIDRRNSNEDEDVDIMTCDNSGEALIVPDPFEESSGSFSDTEPNAAPASFGDPEVESRMYADIASSSMCDDPDEPLRQRYISPTNRPCHRDPTKFYVYDFLY